MVRHDYFLNGAERPEPAAELAAIIAPISKQQELVPETVDKIMGLYSNYMDIEKADAKQECNLDTWYQMLAILYLLLIYCQVVVFWIFACVSISYMKRFFLITDDIPFAEQRRLSAARGGRRHPLTRRSYQEYLHAFNYAFYVQSRVRINRTAELAYLQQYKNQAKEEEIKKQLISVVYKSSFKGKKSRSS